MIDLRKMPMQTKKKLLTLAAAVFIPTVAWLAWGNTTLMVSEFTVTSDKIPESFSGFRIAQVSDLHNSEFGKKNEKLIAMLESTKPDIIVITGDMVDSRNTKPDIAVAFAKQAVKIAPTYYVSGNHEARLSEYGELKNRLKDAGVTVLENTGIELNKADEKIRLFGVKDPSFYTDYPRGDSQKVMERILSRLIEEEEEYTILLSHRPELFETYIENKVDLVFSGHAHGGLIRLPYIGGIYAPCQGLFPKYDAGLYTEESTSMVVSRGLSSSIFPVRVNNQPELVVVELKAR